MRMKWLPMSNLRLVLTDSYEWMSELEGERKVDENGADWCRMESGTILIMSFSCIWTLVTHVGDRNSVSWTN